MNLESSIKENLIKICIKVFQNVDIETDLIEYVNFVEDLGMDSITFIAFIVEIETVFKIIIPDDKLLMENFKNFDDVIALVKVEIERNNNE